MCFFKNRNANLNNSSILLIDEYIMFQYSYLRHCKQRNTRPMKFGYLKIGRCSSVSYKDFGLAFKKCRVFFKKNFKSCVSEVDPKPYITNCIEDTCTCGVRQPCHCEAISSYVNECRRHLGVDIEDWRSLSNCGKIAPPLTMLTEQDSNMFL